MIMLASALWGWYHPRVEYRDKAVWYDATVTLTKTKYVPVKLKTPDCTMKSVDANRDKLPDMLSGNPVTAVGETPPSKTGFDIVTTISPSTGETRIFEQPKKQSLIGFENDKRIGLGAAYVFDREGLHNRFDAHVGWTFARIGGWYVNVYGEVNTRPEGVAKLNSDLHF